MLLPFGCDGSYVLEYRVSGNGHGHQARIHAQVCLTSLLHRLGSPSNVLCLLGRQPSYSCELSLLVRIQSHLERPECLAGCMVVGK